MDELAAPVSVVQRHHNRAMTHDMQTVPALRTFSPTNSQAKPVLRTFSPNSQANETRNSKIVNSVKFENIAELRQKRAVVGKSSEGLHQSNGNHFSQHFRLGSHPSCAIASTQESVYQPRDESRRKKVTLQKLGSGECCETGLTLNDSGIPDDLKLD